MNKSGIALPLAIVLGMAAPAIANESEEVSYPAGEVTAKGYLAMPAEASEEEKVPGVLVVHEWWGHNDYARKRADMLADLGYAALAVDMYGDGKTADHPSEAGEFSAAVKEDADEANDRLKDAMKFLAGQPAVDGDRMAAIGYCFGGSIVLQAALSKVEGLEAVASFHGSLGGLQYPEDGEVGAKVFVAHGAADPFIKEEDIEKFKAEMKRLNADMTFVAYEGASHNFTNPDADEVAEKFDMPIGYDKAADEQSWATLKDFLAGAFKKTPAQPAPR
ncbi:dienelactone hydrolase family protein [soil metagenome]